jgi:hypothetical protein
MAGAHPYYAFFHSGTYFGAHGAPRQAPGSELRGHASPY